MINITIDSKSVTVPKGTTVYQAVKSLGIEIPVFCYQDRMPPFGACRVCLVEVEKMAKLQASCALEATEGMVVHTQSDAAVAGRSEILELLLINHPLDCPICDRGGECPLQDQTIKYGPGLSRFFEEKRHFKKPIPLGPVLMLDRERCIVCARCTRFGDLIAGDHALEFKERGFRTEVGTPDNKQADSKFIGNTIMICPVGALTSQVYRFRARPWDNHHVATTCTLCPVGCSEVIDSRDGEIMRKRSCENKSVNDIWLCDKGWFGYEFVDHPNRLTHPLIRRNGKLVQATWEEALDLVTAKIFSAKESGRLGALGGNPLTVEENYLYQKLFREVGGVNHIDHRIGMPITTLEDEGLPPGMEITIGDCEKLSFVVLLGIDLTEEFPVIWLRLKQAINGGAKVIFIGHFAPEIAPHLSKVVLHAPGKESEILKQHLPHFSEENAAIFIGTQYLNSPNRRGILSELVKLQQTNPHVTLNLLEGRGNSLGARFAGMRPDVGPAGHELTNPGLDAVQIINHAAENGWDYLHIAGGDPATKFPKELWDKARSKLGFLVVQDIFLTETASQADVVLPTLCYVEKEGHVINIEGRAQNIQPGKYLPDALFSDGEIFTLLARKLKVELSVDRSFSDLFLDKCLPKRNFKPSTTVLSPLDSDGKLLASFTHYLFDHGVRMRHNEHLSKLVKPPRVRIHPLEGIKRGIKDNQSVDVNANSHSIKAIVHLDEKIAANTIVLPLGFPEFPVQNLDSKLENGLIVELK